AGADLHRGPHRLLAPVLQRQRPDLQREDPEVPQRDRGEAVRLRARPVLRGPRGAASERAGLVRQPGMTSVETARFDLTDRNRRAIPSVIWRDAPRWGVPVAVVVALLLGLTVLRSGAGWAIAALIGIAVGAGIAVGRTQVLRRAAPAG